MPPDQWFDAHLDLAYLALHGRAMHVPLSDVRMTEPVAALTIPNLTAAGVSEILATVFVQPKDDGQPDAKGPWYFQNSAEAHQAAVAQLDIYDRWFEMGLLQSSRHVDSASRSPMAWLLMEGCDAIRDMGDLDYFHHRGVDAISLTWIHANRWAAGNEARGGLSDDGRKLLDRAAELGIILDVSHLSEEAFFDVLDVYPGQIIASHSNARSLLPLPLQSERNLTDDQIRRLAEVGGVIGINLYSRFLASGRAVMADVIQHIKHIAAVTGSMKHVGLGSDMDGGFDCTSLPVQLESHTDLNRLADAMAQTGFSDDDIVRFSSANWSAVISRKTRGSCGDKVRTA